MNDYQNWNYSGVWLNDSTKMSIYGFFKTKTSVEISDYLEWMQLNKKDFFFHQRDFIFPRLLEQRHFDFADKFLSKDGFDEKIATSTGFLLSLNFDKEVFDYFADKVNSFKPEKQTNILKKFWHEFFSYQFMKDNEFKDNILNLDYVIDKVHFYQPQKLEFSNYYIIKERNEAISNLKISNENEDILLKHLAALCANYYFEYSDLFKEEFKAYPEIIEIYDTILFHQKLNNDLKIEHKYERKNKI